MDNSILGVKGPACHCKGKENACRDFEQVKLDDPNIAFICCTRCGAVIAYRDEFLTGKLDRIIQLLTDIQKR